MSRLTIARIEKLKPGDAVWEEGTGFGARRRQGTTISFVLRYRVDGRPQRLYTFGTYGPMTLDQARTKAWTLRALVDSGVDPKEQNENANVLTLRELVETYMTRHVMVKGRGQTPRLYRGAIDRHLPPSIGNKRAEAITHSDVVRLHTELGVKKSDRTGGRAIANRVITIIGAAYVFGSKLGLIDNGLNPAKQISKFREETRERFLTKRNASV